MNVTRLNRIKSPRVARDRAADAPDVVQTSFPHLRYPARRHNGDGAGLPDTEGHDGQGATALVQSIAPGRLQPCDS